MVSRSIETILRNLTWNKIQKYKTNRQELDLFSSLDWGLIQKLDYELVKNKN